jgi:acyl-CoA thioester hydrolase
VPPIRLQSRLRVRSCDVDSFGHVNNAVYLRYCEAARNDYLLDRGLTFADFTRWEAFPALVAARLEYRLPARTDDELIVYGTLKARGRTRFDIDHEIVRAGDEVLICAAQLEFAFLHLRTNRPCRIPAEFARAFELVQDASQ